MKEDKIKQIDAQIEKLNKQAEIIFKAGEEYSIKEVMVRSFNAGISEGKAQAINEFKENLKSKEFIMSILKDNVIIDEETKMKFICIADVQAKIEKTAQEIK